MRVASLVLGVVVSVVAGCESAQERREGAAVEAAASANRGAASGGQNLYDLPQMRNARLHRERGARNMEDAYGARDPLMRENSFSMAFNDFRIAEDSYHEALISAPTRFRPVIENEVAQVARYMRQIQRDRAPPKPVR